MKPDVETRVSAALDAWAEQIDGHLGRVTELPQKTSDARPQYRTWRWAGPLLVAAAVAAVATTATVLASGSSQPSRIAPMNSPSPTAAAPSSIVTSARPTGQPSAKPVTVPANLRSWILAQPHPQLPKQCPSGFVMYEAPLTTHLTGNPVPDTVANVSCSDSTSGAGSEIDVYGAIDHRYGLIYRVPQPQRKPGLQFSSGDPSVSGHVLNVTIAGYVESGGSHDPMCCPSTRWRQTYTFDGTKVTQGRLAELPSPPPVGAWTGGAITITPRSLGAVTRGMSLADARTAAATPLTMIGDGIFQPADRSLTGSTTLQFAWGATCFDATRMGSGSGTVVSTQAGVRLGDPMSRIAAAYGSAAVPFTADPNWTGAGNVHAGVLVNFSDGVLLFVGSAPDGRSGTITSIRGAADAFHASSSLC